MTIFQKSVALWIGGAVVGGLAGKRLKPASSKGGVVMDALLGAIVVGGIGDAVLERNR